MNEIEFAHAKTDQVFIFLSMLVRKEIDKYINVSVREQDKNGFYQAEISISNQDIFKPIVSTVLPTTLKEQFIFTNLSELPQLVESTTQTLFTRLFEMDQ